MRAFQFKLEKILELRLYEERQCELKLAEATGRCNALHRQIQDRNRRSREVFRERESLKGDLSSFMLVEHFSWRMKQEIEELELELEEAETVRLAMQKEFLEASRKRKILDKLKERKQRVYYREQMKAEQKNLDDISSSMYIRQMEGVK